MKQLLLDFTIAPERSFANFVVGQNRELVAYLQAYANTALNESIERMVYIWGPQGAGKRHLQAAVARAAVRPALRTSDRWPIANAGAIALIEAAQSLSAEAQANCFNAFNARDFASFLVTADCPPKDLPIREDLSTRFGSGLVFRVQPLTDEEKRAALKQHAQTRGFTLADNIADYLINHVRRDMPSLMQTLDQLDTYSLETGKPVTLALVRAALDAARRDSQLPLQ